MRLQLQGLPDGETSACSASLAVGHVAGSFAGRHLSDLATTASPAHGRVVLAQVLDTLRVLAVWTIFLSDPVRFGLAEAEAALPLFLSRFLPVCMEIGVNRAILARAATPQQARGLPGYEWALRDLWSALFGVPLVGYLSQS